MNAWNIKEEGVMDQTYNAVNGGEVFLFSVDGLSSSSDDILHCQKISNHGVGITLEQVRLTAPLVRRSQPFAMIVRESQPMEILIHVEIWSNLICTLP